MRKFLAATLLALLLAGPLRATDRRDVIGKIDVVNRENAPLANVPCDTRDILIAEVWETNAKFRCDPALRRWVFVEDANAACFRGICYADKLSQGGTGTYSDPYIGWDTEFLTKFAADFGWIHFTATRNDITYYSGNLVIDSTVTPGNFTITGCGRDKCKILNEGDGLTPAARAVHLDLNGIDEADRRSHMTIEDFGVEQKTTVLGAGGTPFYIGEVLRLEGDEIGVDAPAGHCSSPEEETFCTNDSQCTGTCTLNDLTSAGTAIDIRGPINFGGIKNLHINGKDQTGFWGLGINLFESVVGNVGPFDLESVYCNRCTLSFAMGRNPVGAVINDVVLEKWKFVPNGGGKPVAGSRCIELDNLIDTMRISDGLCEGAGHGILMSGDGDGIQIARNMFTGIYPDGANSVAIELDATDPFTRVAGLEITGNVFQGIRNHCYTSGGTVDTGVTCSFNQTVECTTGTCSTTTTRACDTNNDCPSGETCTGPAAGGVCNDFDDGQTCMLLKAWQLVGSTIERNFVIPSDSVNPYSGCRNSTIPNSEYAEPIFEDETPGQYTCADDATTVCDPLLFPNEPGYECPANVFCIYNSNFWRYDNVRWDQSNPADNDRVMTAITNNLQIGRGSQFQNPTIFFNAMDQQGKTVHTLRLDMLNHFFPRFEMNHGLWIAADFTAFESIYSTNGGVFAGDATFNDVDLDSLRIFRGNPQPMTIASGGIDVADSLNFCRGSQTTTCTEDYDCASCSNDATKWCDEDVDCGAGNTCNNASRGVCDTIRPMVKIISSETGTSDSLTDVDGGSNGDVIVLTPQAGHEIEIVDSNNGGDIAMHGPFAQNCTLDSVAENITLVRFSPNNWHMVASNGCDYRDVGTQPLYWRVASGLTATHDANDWWEAKQSTIVTEVTCHSDDATLTFDLDRDDGSPASMFSGGSCTCNGSACTLDTNQLVFLDGWKIDYDTIAPGTATYISVQIGMTRWDE